ncbi:MAG: SulP family inorganic anion transporter, partial [Alkalispirochaetaceae bacterium]
PRNTRNDIFGGITTAVVSLPMALAFGVASGAGAQAGLYGAIIVGLFAAIFGGTSTLISEPTGPMTVLMTAVVTQLVAQNPDTGMAMAFTVVMVAGVVQIVFGYLKLGRYITLMPYSVISGFMSGIGVLLVINQIPSFLGVAAADGGAFEILRSLPSLLGEASFPEYALSALSLLMLLLTPKKWRRYVPPQLLVLLLGTVGASLLLESGTVRTIGRIPMGLPQLVIPTFTSEEATQIVLDGLVLGLLGCIDTLLTAMIADSLTREHHNSNRELLGQGIGNLLSGLFGGLPGAGATMGTVVNIQTGARSPFAAVVRSLLLLAVVLAIGPALASVPMAVLAAITIKVGIDILDWSFLGRAHKISANATIVMYSVLLLTVFVDLIVAVGVGVFIANILTIERLSSLAATKVTTIDPSGDPVVVSEEERRILEEAEGKVVLFHLSGPMIFGVAQAINRESAAMSGETRALVIDLAEVSMLGTTVAIALENVIRDARQTGKGVYISGASEEAKRLLGNVGIFGEGVYLTDNRLQALERAASYGELDSSSEASPV